MTGPTRRRSVRSAAWCAVVAVAGAGVLAACGSSTPQGSSGHRSSHTVTDMSGAKVSVPRKVDRIAEQFPAHTVTDLMLGVADKLVGISNNVKTLPFLAKVDPGITSVPELFKSGGPVNMEELLRHKPDVVSALPGDDGTLKPFAEAGLPAVDLSFTTFPELVRSMTLAGQIYGGDANRRAQRYNAYFESKLKMVRSRLKTLPDSDKPGVVHIASFPPLVVDGGDSIIDQWIKFAGGTDAATGVASSHITVTFEQLLKWNPDVIIVETPGGDQGIAAGSGQSVVAALQKEPGWSGLKAVRSKHVYINPQGLYPWDRFGPEEALQIQWAAKTLHPDQFKDLDMRKVTRSFYQTFFGYDMSAAELDQMLGAHR